MDERQQPEADLLTVPGNRCPRLAVSLWLWPTTTLHLPAPQRCRVHFDFSLKPCPRPPTLIGHGFGIAQCLPNHGHGSTASPVSFFLGGVGFQTLTFIIPDPPNDPELGIRSVKLKVINSEMILLRFALISVSMANQHPNLPQGFQRRVL